MQDFKNYFMSNIMAVGQSNHKLWGTVAAKKKTEAVSQLLQLPTPL